SEIAVLRGHFSATVLLDLTWYGHRSCFVKVEQGILAGCARAACMLEVLTLRALLRVREVHGALVPRALVDDVSVQYVGPDPAGVRALGVAVRAFQDDSTVLGSCFNHTKSGAVAATTSPRRLMRGSKFQQRPWMRNLGHETMGARPLRWLETGRLRELQRRRRRIRIFRQVAGRKNSVRCGVRVLNQLLLMVQ
ncbi:unnamed protein product, partial [Prorocentrum cordatum]